MKIQSFKRLERLTAHIEASETAVTKEQEEEIIELFDEFTEILRM